MYLQFDIYQILLFTTFFPNFGILFFISNDFKFIVPKKSILTNQEQILGNVCSVILHSPWSFPHQLFMSTGLLQPEITRRSVWWYGLSNTADIAVLELLITVPLSVIGSSVTSNDHFFCYQQDCWSNNIFKDLSLWILCSIHHHLVS